MPRKTRESVRRSLFDSYFSNENHERELTRLEQMRVEQERIDAERREAEAARPPSFDNVQSQVASTEPDSEQAGGFLSGLLDQGQAALQRTYASAQLQRADEAADARTRERGWFEQGFVGPDEDERLRAVEEEATGIYRQQYDASRANTDLARRSLDTSVQAIGENLGATPTAAWLARQGAEGLYDVLGSPASVASVIPIVGGGIAGADAYNQEYLSARSAGINPEDAGNIAATKATIEAGLGTLPGGALLRRIPGVGRFVPTLTDELDTITKKLLVRIPQTALGEGANEVLTAWSQMGVDSLVADRAETQAVRDHATSQLPKDVSQFWDATWRNFRGGLLGGAMLGSPIEGIQVFSELGVRIVDELYIHIT